jgi:DNA-binding beta-propeller fold protein YncE
MSAPLTLRLAALAVLTAWLVPSVPAGEKESKYPRVNTAVSYAVDPAWPERPKDFRWGHMPGIAVDAKDNIYVFTRAEPPVQVYSSTGKYLRGWGEKQIKSAHHIRIDHEGNVWIADVGHHVVQKYTPEGTLLMTLGVKGQAGRDDKHLYMPTDMAVTRTGDIFVSDGYGNARIVHFDKEGNHVNAWGELGHGPGQFSIPHSIAADSKGRLYVADRNNARIQVFNEKGKFLEEWRNMIVPWGLWVTPKDEIWVCGSSPMQWRKEDSSLGCPPKDQIFMKFNPHGKLLQLFTVPKGLDGLERPGEVNWVHAIAVDSRGNLYLGDIVGKRAQKFVMRAP